MKILVVEDNSDVARALCKLLRISGFEAAKVENGTDGMNAIFEQALGPAPDVVLLDLNLPEIPGDQILRRMRAENHPAKVAVITASKVGLEGVRPLNPDLLLLKPISYFEDLVPWLKGVEAGMNA